MKQTLPDERFARSAALLVSGTAAGQALVILSSPVLTRVYSPQDFGSLAVYAALLAFTTLVASMRYEFAIPLVRTDRGAANVLSLSLLVVLGVVGVTAVLIGLFGRTFAVWANAPMLEPYLWALPFAILLGGANKVLTYWALRKKAFARIARVRFQQGGTMAASQMALGWLHWGALGLIVGQILGYTAGLINLSRFIAGPEGVKLRQVRPRWILYSAKRFRNFPIYSSWSDMANVGGTQLPLILFASLFSPVVAGFYMLAHRVASAPAALMAEATGKAFMAHAVSARRNGHLPELTERVFALLLRTGLGPLVLVAVIAPEFFAVIFGASWLDAGRYLQWMMPWLAAVFVFAPLTTLYVVLERQRLDLCFQITLLLTRLSALILGAIVGGPLMATACYSTSAAVVYVAFGSLLLHAAGVSYARIMQIVGKELSFIALLGSPLVLVKLWLGIQTPLHTDPATLFLLSFALLLGAFAIIRVRPLLHQMRSVPATVAG